MIHNAKIKEATGYAVSSFSLLIYNSIFNLLLNCVIFISIISLDKYELGVSNAWNATKLYINADIAPINDFKKRFAHNPHFHSLYISGQSFFMTYTCAYHFFYSLGVEDVASSQSQSLASLSCGSQMYTQSSSSSQYNATDKFFDKAISLPLAKIMALSEVIP
jgi:hypothetical protein